MIFPKSDQPKAVAAWSAKAGAARWHLEPVYFPEILTAIGHFYVSGGYDSQIGLSFFEYMRDRIAQLGNIPSLGAMIREQSYVHFSQDLFLKTKLADY